MLLNTGSEIRGVAMRVPPIVLMTAVHRLHVLYMCIAQQ